MGTFSKVHVTILVLIKYTIIVFRGYRMGAQYRRYITMMESYFGYYNAPSFSKYIQHSRGTVRVLIPVYNARMEL